MPPSRAPQGWGPSPMGGRGGASCLPAARPPNNVPVVRCRGAPGSFSQPLPALLRFGPALWEHNGWRGPRGGDKRARGARGGARPPCCSHAEGCEGCGALAAVLEPPWERAGPPQEKMGVGGSPPEPGGGGRGAGGQLGHHMGRGQPRLGLSVPAMGGLRGLRERRSFLPSLRPLGGTGCSPPVPVPADGCPFPPPRTNSDSALHTSVMNPAPQDAYLGPSQGAPPPGRRGGESLPCPPAPRVTPRGGLCARPLPLKISRLGFISRFSGRGRGQ